MTWKIPAAALGLALGVDIAAAQQKPPAQPPRQTFSAPAQPQPATPTASWDGTWSGSFGARMDVALTISGNNVTGLTFFGAQTPLVSSSVSGATVRVTVAEFSLTLTRFTATAAQTIYENRRQEKAVTLLNRS